MKQQAWMQARGAYARERLHCVDPESENSTQHVVTALATAAELHFVGELQPISSNWVPANYRAWTLAEFCPASLAGTSNSCRIAWFAPGGTIEDMAQLWAAVAVWTEAEIILRGPHGANHGGFSITDGSGHQPKWKARMVIHSSRARGSGNDPQV